MTCRGTPFRPSNFLHEGSAALELLFRQPEAKGAWWLWMKKFNDEHSATAACNHGVAFVGYFAICLGASKKAFGQNEKPFSSQWPPLPMSTLQSAGCRARFLHWTSKPHQKLA